MQLDAVSFWAWEAISALKPVYNLKNLDSIMTEKRVKHAFKHAQEIFWKWNNQRTKYWQQFESIIKDTLNNSEKIVKWMVETNWKKGVTFDRFIKNWIQVDIFTSWDKSWLLRTVTRIKK